MTMYWCLSLGVGALEEADDVVGGDLRVLRDGGDGVDGLVEREGGERLAGVDEGLELGQGVAGGGEEGVSLGEGDGGVEAEAGEGVEGGVGDGHGGAGGRGSGGGGAWGAGS